jgi:hypothetical protein
VIKFLQYFIQFTWGILQNLIGFIAFLAVGLCARKFLRRHETAFVSLIKNNFGGSACAGVFLFVSNDNAELIKHEYGHTIQSLILGPFWLLVIGIPSFVWAAFFESYRKRKNKSYYSFYTERWANRLADVKEELIVE